MASVNLQKLAAARARVAKLEAAFATGLRRELALLPGRFGFSDAEAFITAIREAAGKRRGRKPGSVTVATAATGGRPRKRTVITDKIRARVKQLVKEGKTGAAIAKSQGISLPSVQNIKKAFGLVKERK